MSRIVIMCPNSKCRRQITLSAHTEVRILANVPAQHVHADLEKHISECRCEECKAKPEITPPPSEQRINTRMLFEAVMTTYQPTDIFQAIVQACKDRRLYTQEKNTNAKVFDSGEFTEEDMDYVINAYDNACQEATI